MKPSSRRFPLLRVGAALLLMSVGVTPLFAQGIDGPVAVPVRFWGGGGTAYSVDGVSGLMIMIPGLESYPGAGNGTKSISGAVQYDPSFPPGTQGFICSSGGQPHATVRLEPGKRYAVQFSGYYLSNANLGLAAPPGYRVEINGVVRQNYSTPAVGEPFFSHDVTLRILPSAGEIPGPAGAPSSMANGRLFWQVALGALQNGGSAGAISLIDAGTGANWNSAYTPAVLHYQEPSSEVIVHRQTTGVLRQILARETSVDIVSHAEDSSLGTTQFELRFYLPGQTQGSSFPRTFTGEPFAIYRVEPGTSTPSLKITRRTRDLTSLTATGQAVVRTSQTTVSRTGTWPAFTWTVDDWHQGSTALVRTVLASGGTTSARTETRTQSVPGGSPALSVSRTYALQGWGEELVTETIGTSNAITTTYAHYTTASEVGRYGFVKSVSRTGGEWEAYDYWSSSTAVDAGRIKYRFRPYKDTPASPSFDPTLGEVTYFEYGADPFGIKSRPTLVETKINNTLVFRSETSYADVSGAVNGMTVVTATRQDRTSNNPSDILTTLTRFYREDTGDAFFRGQTHSVTSAGGVKTSYAYQRGSLSGTTFTKSGSAGLGAGTASRSIIIRGTTQSSGHSFYQTHDGYDIDDLYLVAGKSTMEVVIRGERAQVVRTESHAWSGTAWALVGFVDFAYDLNGRLITRTASNGATYSATHAGEFLLTATDETGVHLTHEYDAAGRVFKITKAAGGPLSHALTTTFTYNALSQTLSETLGSAGVAEAIVTARTYDDAGRLTSITPPGQAATTISYNPAARTRTTTAPHDGMSVETTQPDGRLASLTGSANVAQFYTYAVETDGRQRTQVNVGTSSSPRWTKSWTDWLGRAVRSERPGFSPSNQQNFVEELFYDDATIGKGRLYKVTRTGFAASTRYVYDALGNVVRSGLDVNNNGLVLASHDRITDSDTVFEQYAGAWWLKTTTKIYPTVDSATPVTTGFSRTRLTGFTSGVQAETQSTDAEGNVTTTTVTVARSTKTVTSATTRSGVAGSASVVVINGLSVSATGHDGLTTKAEYDALGRTSESIDTRNKATTFAYVSGTALPYSTQDPAGNFVRRNGYDSSGRVVWTQDARNHVARVSYTALGQVQRQWGGAAYPIEYCYDLYGNRTTMKTYRGGTGWTDTDWPTATTGTADTTTWDFDAATGALWKKTDANGRSVEFDYYSSGQLATRKWARTLRNSQTRVTTTYLYDGDTGELTGQSYNDGTPAVTYDYTPRLGQIESITDYTGTWDYVYDSAKPWRQSAAGLPSFYGSRTWTLLYESSGVVGRYRGFQLGSSPGSAADLEQAYTFTTAGRFSTLTSGRAGNSVTRTFEYAYRADAPWVSALSISGGHAFTVTRDYDAQRPLLSSIETKWGSTGDPVVKYAYTHTALGQRRTATQSGTLYKDYYEGTAHTAVTRYFDYNSRGEVSAESLFYGAAVPGQPASTDELPGRRTEYRYDSIGNRRSSGPSDVEPGTPNSPNDEYTTNALNQYTKKENNLVRVTGTVAAGAKVFVEGATSTALTERAWAADVLPANAESAAKGGVKVYAGKLSPDTVQTGTRTFFVPPALQTFAHDADGNQLHDSVWSYQWDAENRLIAMEHRSEVIGAGMLADADARRLEFRYDYQGRRVRKTVYGGWNGSTFDATPLSDVKFLYDGWNLVAEFRWNSSTSTFDLNRSFTWGLDLAGSLTASGGVGALLQIHDYQAGKTLLPAYDGNGNVVALVNAESGTLNLEARYEYTSFGKPIRAEGDYAHANPFRFSSKYTDSETGLAYYGYRYYSATIGRFINRDPIGEVGGWNLYAIVGNRKPNRVDVLGMYDREWYKDSKLVFRNLSITSGSVGVGTSAVVQLNFNVTRGEPVIRMLPSDGRNVYAVTYYRIDTDLTVFFNRVTILSAEVGFPRYEASYEAPNVFFPDAAPTFDFVEFDYNWRLVGPSLALGPISIETAEMSMSDGTISAPKVFIGTGNIDAEIKIGDPPASAHPLGPSSSIDFRQPILNSAHPPAASSDDYGPTVVLSPIVVSATVPRGTIKPPSSGAAGARSPILIAGGIATSNPSQIAELLGSIPGFDPGAFAAAQKSIFAENNQQ